MFRVQQLVSEVMTEKGTAGGIQKVREMRYLDELI